MKLLLTKLPNGGWVIVDGVERIGAYSNDDDMINALWKIISPEPVPEPPEPAFEPGAFVAILRNEERIKKADQDKLDKMQMAVFGKLCDCPICTAARKMK